jgi:hypothetical protein
MTKFIIKGREETRVDLKDISFELTDKIIVDKIKYKINEIVYDSDNKNILYYLEEDK